MTKALLLGFFLVFVCCSNPKAAPQSVRIVIPGQGELSLTASPPIILLALRKDVLLNELKTSAPTSGDLTFSFNHLAFDNTSQFQIVLSADVDGSHQTHRFGCKIKVRFAMPASRLLTPSVQDLGGDADCRVGGTIGGALGIGSMLSSTIAGQTAAALKKAAISSIRLVSSSDNLQEFLRLDEDLTDFLVEALIQLSNCTIGTDEHLCVRIEWPANILQTHIHRMQANAPQPSGSLNVPAINTLLTQLSTLAPRKTIQDAAGVNYSYPAKKRESGEYDDGDMAIFGGLICASGIEEGCELVRRAQGPTGQWWRSPSRIGENPGAGESQFSGDQLNGVIAYFLQATHPTMASSFEKFLTFVSGTRFNIPPTGAARSVGYKSCLIDANNTCALIGQEWFWLNTIARKLNKQSYVPVEERAPEAKYGYSLNELEWTALLTPKGYRLHLVSLQLMHAKAAGLWGPTLASAAKTLAGREPKNPFFLFLYLGKDATVQSAWTQRCQPDAAQKDFDEWSWERQEEKMDWKRKMIWDCLAVGSMLLQ